MKTVLIVDDRPTNRELLATLLGYGGHRLLEASDGSEALAVAQQHEINLIVSDILMPVMDGFELVRRLRADPHTASIPVMFVTATFLRDEATALGRSAGVDRILYKPIDPEEFLAAANELLNRGHSAAETSLRGPPADDEHLQLLTNKLIRMTDLLRSANDRLQAQTTMVLRLQNCGSEDEIGGVVSCFAPQLLPRIPGALFILNNSHNLLNVAASWNSPRGLNTDFVPEECWAFRRGQLHEVKRTHGDVVCGHVNRDGIEQYSCRPLAAQGETLGVLYIEAVLPSSSSENYEVTGQDIDAFAENVSLALGNLHLREKLRDQSIRDPLTGLFNRRYLEEALELELARAIRGGSQVSLIMADVDHFKEFNDCFGHDAGDAVLTRVADQLRAKIRRGDIACRFGGEEFLLLLPGAGCDGARQRAEEIRQAVRSLKLERRGRAFDALTISLGVATFPDHAIGPSELIMAADAAMYAAKRAGRDRVETSSAASAADEETPQDVPSLAIAAHAAD